MNIEKDNTGLIFINNSDNESAPAYRGGINVNGEQFEIALWYKEFKGGSTGFSAKISPPFEKGQPTARSERSGGLKPKARPKVGYKSRVDDEEVPY